MPSTSINVYIVFKCISIQVLIVTHSRNSLSYLSADLDCTIAIISHVLFINVLTLLYIYIQI